MKNTRKGFTLVELLAVIVILAIIMIIAIPAVLQTMNLARQKTFKEYITKVYTAAQTYQVAQAAANVPNKGAAGVISDTTGEGATGYTCYVYDIHNIGLSSVGDYKGTIIICERLNNIDSNAAVYIALEDANYSTGGLYNYSQVGEMDVTKLSAAGVGTNVYVSNGSLTVTDLTAQRALITAANARTSDLKVS